MGHVGWLGSGTHKNLGFAAPAAGIAHSLAFCRERDLTHVRTAPDIPDFT